jgi:hypothetical protein
MVKSQYVPSTIIIDGDGEMLSPLIEGAYGEAYGEVLTNILESIKS